ncbi:MAG: MBL fold metallo-hydrolase [Peptostreptococcaceae bacterium]|jgi:competence protein ComEC|nr:MBL fold metallo-hydrolase [Peptostreptococcaceae bacterium]
MSKYIKSIYILFVIIFFVIYLFCFPISSTNNRIPKLELHFIDVGQGDCTLIITPNKSTILIDSGTENQKERVIKYLNKENIKKIDLLIGTHSDSDHIGSMDKIIKNFEIKKFTMPNYFDKNKDFIEIINICRKKNLNIIKAHKNMSFSFDNNISIKFLNPDNDESNANNSSIASLIKFKNNSFLFLGDIDSKEEMQLLEKYPNLKVDMLKIAHHGSKNSYNNYFYNTIQFKIALISCGYENKYNHPHKIVLERLYILNKYIFRTDLQGNIILKSDGSKIYSNKKPFNYIKY